MRIYLACGLLALAVFYLLPAGFFSDVVYYPALGFAASAAIVAGTVWHRPRHTLPWLLIATGQALFGLTAARSSPATSAASAGWSTRRSATFATRRPGSTT